MTFLSLTNLASLYAQGAILQHTRALNVNLQRLSTGLRINSAADDPTGLAISTRLLSQINGVARAIQNVNDGVSLASVADAGIESIESDLQSIRTEALAASNGSATAADRAAAQAVIDQLLTNIDATVSDATFNGKALLDGTFTGASIQAGANAGLSILIDAIRDLRSTSLGAFATVTGGNVTGNTLDAGDLSISGVSIRTATAADDTVSTASNATSALAKATAINASYGATSVTATASTTITGTAAVQAVTLNAVNTLTINGVQIGSGASPISVLANDSNSALQNAINAVSSTTGVTATLNGANQVVLAAADGRNIVIAVGGQVGAPQNRLGLNAFAGTNRGTITLSGDTAFTLAGGAPGDAGLVAGTYNLVGSSALASIDVTTQASATAALTVIDRAIDQASYQRAVIGGTVNVLESAVTRLESLSTEYTDARGRIVDADIAAESAASLRNQLLLESATAILAQAQIPLQNAVTLLITKLTN